MYVYTYLYTYLYTSKNIQTSLSEAPNSLPACIVVSPLCRDIRMKSCVPDSRCILAAHSVRAGKSKCMHLRKTWWMHATN